MSDLAKFEFDPFMVHVLIREMTGRFEGATGFYPEGFQQWFTEWIREYAERTAIEGPRGPAKIQVTNANALAPEWRGKEGGEK